MNRLLWEAHLKQWNLLGPPLRPCAEDLRLFQKEIGSWSTSHAGEPAQALVLGVTPEFPVLDWPAGSRVYSADTSVEMIEFLWYRSAPFAGGAVAAKWQALPFMDACMDIVLGDGSFTMSSWPDGYAELCESVARVLKPGGRMLARFHVRPQVAETPETVFDALEAGNVRSFNAFKWRLVTALHGDRNSGLRLSDVWNAWSRRHSEAATLAARTGWHEAIINTIHAYRDSGIVYSIPRVPELRELLARHFRELACHRPAYDAHDHYRVIALERSGPG